MSRANHSATSYLSFLSAANRQLGRWQLSSQAVPLSGATRLEWYRGAGAALWLEKATHATVAGLASEERKESFWVGFWNATVESRNTYCALFCAVVGPLTPSVSLCPF